MIDILWSLTQETQKIAMEFKGVILHKVSKNVSKIDRGQYMRAPLENIKQTTFTT